MVLLAVGARAETNYVYVSGAQPLGWGPAFSYSVDPEKVTIGSFSFAGPIDWSAGVRVVATTSAIPAKFENISQVTVFTNILPLAESAKTDWENAFTKQEKAIMATIKKLISRLPAQYRPTDDEIKEVIRAELQK
mgnify:CR=1 FL=1